MVHIDRELKYRARIPVPSGISLVGVADVHGELEEGQVYGNLIIFCKAIYSMLPIVCIQRADEESQYFPAKPGYIYVTRSPQIHPGDSKIHIIPTFITSDPLKSPKIDGTTPT